jgi:hypothetical protein
MAEFEFVEELPTRIHTPRGGPNERLLLEAFAEALQARPGVWAKWPFMIRPQTVSTYRKRIKYKTMPAFQSGHYEAADRNSVLYVRYTGTEVTDGR